MQLPRVLFVCTLPLVILFSTSVRKAYSTQPEHLLLLLDTSPAMVSQNRIYKVSVALKGWIQDQAPEGMKISLWKFAEGVVKEASTLITGNSTSRQEIIKNIPERMKGDASISHAIEAVVKNTSEINTILLITAGKDKFFEDDSKELQESLKTCHCNIISALIGNASKMYLFEYISPNSVNYIPDSNVIFGILDVLQKTVRNTTDFTPSITIFEKEIFPIESQFQLEFVVDSSVSLSENVCVTIYNWPYNVVLNLTYEGNTNQYLSNVMLKEGYMKHCLLGKKEGLWKVDMQSSTFNKFIGLQVSAYPKQESSAITFDCWVQKGVYYPSICGYLHAANTSIKEVNSSVVIVGQFGKEIYLELLPLYSENDFPFQKCISARKYLNINNLQENDYYSVHCQAEGQFIQDKKTTTQPDIFTRISWGGTLKMNRSSTESYIALSIADMKIFCTARNAIVLEFTVPYQALKYKIMLSTSLYTILAEDGLLLGTAPGLPGTTEKITFTLPHYLMNQTAPLFVALKTVGQNGIESEVSNIEQVTCHNYSSISEEEDMSSDVSVQLTSTKTPELDTSTITSYTNDAGNISMMVTVEPGIKNLTKSMDTNTKNSPSASMIIIVTIMSGIVLVVLTILIRIYYVRSQKRSGSYYVQCQYRETGNNE